MTDVKKIFKNKYLVVVFALLACLLWGSAFPYVKIGYELFGITGGETSEKILFAGYRFLLAGLLLLFFAILSKQDLKLKPGQMKQVLLLGLFMTTIQYTFFYLGLSNTTGVKGAILNSTTVFFTLILAHFLLKNDFMNQRKVLGLVIGFAGVIIINYSPELLRFEFSLEGEGYLLIAQLSGAYGGIYLKRISHYVSIIAMTAYQMIAGSLLLIIPTVSKVGIWPFEVKSLGYLLLIYLAFLSAAAFSLWNTLVKYNKVGKLAIYKFLIPVFGVLLSGLLLSAETITLNTILALTIVSFGIVIVNYTPKPSKNPEATNGQ